MAHVDRHFEPPHLDRDLIDGELTLRLRDVKPARPEIGWVAAMEFDMLHSGTGEQMGQLNLRFGVTDELLFHGGQIGYSVHPEFRGQHYSARAVRLVLPLAREAGMETIWITCDPENIASKRSIEIAGGEFVEIRQIAEWSPMYAMGRRESLRFRFDL